MLFCISCLQVVDGDQEVVGSSIKTEGEGGSEKEEGEVNIYTTFPWNNPFNFPPSFVAQVGDHGEEGEGERFKFWVKVDLERCMD